MHLLSSTHLHPRLFFCALDFFKETPVSCDGHLDDTEMESTSLATAPRKCRIFGDLDNSTHNLLDDVSSTDCEDNFLSLDFSTKSDSAPNQPRT